MQTLFRFLALLPLIALCPLAGALTTTMPADPFMPSPSPWPSNARINAAANATAAAAAATSAATAANAAATAATTAAAYATDAAMHAKAVADMTNPAGASAESKSANDASVSAASSDADAQQAAADANANAQVAATNATSAAMGAVMAATAASAAQGSAMNAANAATVAQMNYIMAPSPTTAAAATAAATAAADAKATATAAAADSAATSASANSAQASSNAATASATAADNSATAANGSAEAANASAKRAAEAVWAWMPNHVRPVQRPNSKLVDIDYDVSKTSGQLTIGLLISADGGSTWAVPAKSLTGAIGSVTLGSSNLRITWDAGADWNQKFSTQTQFRLTVAELSGWVARAYFQDSTNVTVDTRGAVNIDAASWIKRTDTTEVPWGFRNCDGMFLTRGHYSDDGINWTAITKPTDIRYWLNCIGYGNGTFVLNGAGNDLWTSSDLANWTRRGNPGGYDDLTTIVYGNGTFVMRRFWANGAMIVSKDNGVNWTYVDTGGSPSRGYGTLVFGNGKFIYPIDNRVRTSVDGLSWNETTVSGIPVGFEMSAVGQFESGFFIGAHETSRTGDSVNVTTACSSDGANWTFNQSILTSSSTGAFYSSGSFNGLLTLTSESSPAEVWVSSDKGVTWVKLDGPWNVAGNVHATFAANKDRIVVATDNGIYSVENGLNKTIPIITKQPVAGSITYGQTLASSALMGGLGSVSGGFTFNAPSTVPSAGTFSASYTFTPTDAVNYSTVTGMVSVTVKEGSATYQVTNVYSGDGSEDVLFQNEDGSLLNGGIVAIGYFPENYEIPSSVSQANIAAAVANFTPLSSALCGSYSASLGGSFPGYVEGEPLAGVNSSILIGRPLYVFVGNASTLAASTSIAIRQMDVFRPNKPPFENYYGLYVIDFIDGAHAPAIGKVSTYTGMAWPEAGYVSTYQTLQLVGRQAATVITPPTASAITYGQALASSALSGGMGSVAGSFAFTSPATIPNAGTVSQEVTFTPTDAVNYTTASDTVSVTVNKATPAITTAPTASAITSGQTLVSSTLSGGAASAAGVFTFTSPSTAPSVGAASQGFTFTPTDTTNFTTVTGTVSVTVNKATPTITMVPIASAITYGQTLTSSTLSGGAGSVTGTFAFTTPATVPTAGTANQAWNFMPTDTTNYNTATGTVSVTVSKAIPTITILPTATSITYGQTLVSSNLSGGVGSVAGRFAFTASSTVPSVGNYSASYTFTPTDTLNYASVTGVVSVTVKEGSAIYQVTNVYSGDGSEDVLFQNADGSLLNGGIVAIGYFPENYIIPSSVNQANIAAAVDNFTPLSSALCGSYSASLEGSFPGYVEGEQVAGVNTSNLIGRPLYVFVGNASTLAASTSIAIRQMGVFQPNNPPYEAYYGLYILDFIRGTPAPLMGAVGTFTGMAWPEAGYVSNYQTLQLTGPPAATITTLPAASAITYGQTLASSILSGGTASVGGVFAFTTPSTVPSAGIYAASFTFTPSDSVNYGATTGTVNVTVNAPISITAQPVNVTVNQGASAVFSVTAMGTAPTYQWKKAGVNIAGATGATLTLNNVQPADAANYTVVMTNVVGSVTSQAASLAVISTASTLFAAVETTLPLTDAALVSINPIGKFSVVTGAAAHSAGNALKFQTVNSGSTYAERTIVGPSLVSFSWRVSSEEDFDIFKYSVDGMLRKSISGDGAWLNESLQLGEGTHTIRWTYSKDEADANFEDAGYLDDLAIVSAYTNLEVTAAGVAVTGSRTLDYGTILQNVPEITQELTFKNTGTLPMDVVASLPDGCGFVFDAAASSTEFSLGAGEETVVGLILQTAVPGQKTALLYIDAADSQTALPTITLSGYVLAALPNMGCSWSGGPLANGQSAAIDFGNAPNDINFTVGNTGTVALAIASVSVSPATDFEVISQPNSTVEVNGNTSFTLRALDANRGNHRATVTIVSDDPNTPNFSFPVASESTPNIACSWSGGVLDNGQGAAMDFGTTPNDISVSIGNTGSAALAIASLSVEPATDFQVIVQPASTVAINGSTSFTLRALALHRGDHQAIVTIVSNGGNAPSFSFPVASQSYPNITCSSSGGALTSGQSTAIDFGTAPNDIAFTVGNTGSAPLAIGSVSVSPATDFEVISQPNFTVGLNGSTSFTLRALDANRGNHSATVTIASDDPNTPNFSFPVASQSTPNIACSWSGGVIVNGQGAAMDFGTTPNDITVSIGNSGSAALAIASVTVEPATDFQVIAQPASTVAINGNTNFTLRALALHRGDHQAIVTIVSNGGNAPSFSFPVASRSYPNITCRSSGGALTSGQSAALDFGTAPNDIVFTVGNTGSAPLAIASVSVSPATDFEVISQPDSTVGLNGSTSFTLRALDANRGNHSATVTIVSDDPNVPSFSFPVASESTPNMACSWSGWPLTNGQSAAMDFGTTPNDITVNIGNTGSAALVIASVSIAPTGDFQVIRQPSASVAINGSTTFTLRALEGSHGSHSATVTIASNDGSAPSFSFSVTSQSYLAATGTSFVSGSFTNTGTTAGWSNATVTLPSGSSGQALKTGTTPDNGSSTIGATFDGPGLLSWNWQVSAQANYDWLLCEVNGVEVAGISVKTAAWQSQVVQIPAGASVRWIYRKDGSNLSGSDTGYLSDIYFSKFTAPPSSFSDWSVANGKLNPTQLIPAGGMQAMFAWLGGVNPATGPAAVQYKPSVSGGFYKYRYSVAKAAAGIVQPQISTDLVTWNSRRMKQTLISEDDASAVVELSVPATGKVFSRMATDTPTYAVPAPVGFVLVAAGSLPSSSEMGAQSVATFLIATAETTWGTWQTVRTWAAAHGYDLGGVGAGNGDTYPVTNVSWYQSVKWCNARSEMEGLTPVYTVNGSTYRTGNSTPDLSASANGYRLPGEAEWEFAARGGINTHGYNYGGSNDLDAVAWYNGNSGWTSHSVATKAANELGLYDMLGNVWEWCYDSIYGSNRVYRGSSWRDGADYCRIAVRFGYDPSWADGTFGFRVARSSVP